ncbi:fimbria/pilus outer membrane usher protein [Sinorhizobium garamanticum]|uniref:Fimbria/pilus outer membrane usher protein n=1 Tax=Sinorhizobium garamanticum TaxID=680247 RepID=A0ABY8D4H4_9HYPH|nr:fimbria/pilus outer membrane usher protein [Sinorhizobium garamanticum]WEX85754.1 fimbria/pilus outer membrane usher protein [Sinorhizobium garamanticum]
MVLGAAISISAAAGANQINNTNSPSPGAAGQARDLYLEVFINGVSTGLIGNFKQLPDGGLAATEAELTEVGLKPVRSAQADGLVRVDRLPNVSFRLDEPAQRLYVTSTDEARAPRTIDIGTIGKSDRPQPQSSLGAVLNYTLFGSSNSLFEKHTDLFQGVSGAFDTRLFSPYGTLSQSFIAGYSNSPVDRFTRLNTTWSYSDPNRLVTYRAGDVVSGGLSWTRPVYLGGLQVQRNFALRSDLVTMPLPSFSGRAAVPSTLEVYSQNARTFTGTVAPGPFQLVNLPVFTGATETRVVLRDSLGRETTATLPFYASSSLLREGLLDFSAELGYPRRNFGIESQDYDGRLMGVATARYGLTDWLTLEGHFEGGNDLLNGGIGAAFPIWTYGVGSVAVASSEHNGRTGSLVNASLELRNDRWSIFGRVQRTFGQYEDIASITAKPSIDPRFPTAFSAKVPRALDQVAVSVPTPFDASNLTFSYTNLDTGDSERSRIAGVSYSQQIFGRSTLFATAFKDFGNKGGFGLFAGLSIPLGSDINTTTAIEHGRDGTNFVADVTRSERLEEGSVGWRVRTSEGKTTNRSAAVSYRAPVARVQAGVEQYGGSVRATGQVDGAIVVAGGDVFASNRIDDAFAVVDVGAPNVEVQHQNRRVGTSNRRGRIVVPGLNSYEPNTISIDPSNLPVDADIASTRQVVVPADRSGVVIDFGVNNKPNAALVRFIDSRGLALEAGLKGRLLSGSGEFVIGYDGEAYIRSLSSQNTVEIQRVDGASCRAEFQFRPDPGRQVVLKDVPCH